MSRPKSQQALDRERERAYQRQARERKRLDRERRRQRTEELHARREGIRNAKLKADSAPAAVFAVIRHRVTLFCTRCHTARKQADMIEPELCDRCYYAALVSEEREPNPTQPRHQLDLFLA